MPRAAGLSTLLREATSLGVFMQVRAPGFVPNERLRLQAGLAVLEVAQRIRPLLTLNLRLRRRGACFGRISNRKRRRWSGNALPSWPLLLLPLEPPKTLRRHPQGARQRRLTSAARVRALRAVREWLVVARLAGRQGAWGGCKAGKRGFRGDPPALSHPPPPSR